MSHVILMVNSECNARCKHCYLPYEGKRSPEDTLRLVEQLTQQRHKITIAGSETLLDLGYLDSYEMAEQDYVLTNGILLIQQPQIFDDLSEHGIEEIRTSLHFGIQDHINSVPESIVAEVIKQSRDHGFRVLLATVLMSQNYRDVVDICRRTYDLGANAIKFIRCVSSRRAKDNSLPTLTEDQRVEFYKLVDYARSMYDKEELEIIIHGNFGPRYGTRGEQLARSNQYCLAGREMLVVAPDNTVYGCPFLMEYPIGELIGTEFDIQGDLAFGRRDRCITDYLL